MKCKVEYPFQRQIQQIVFPTVTAYEDLTGNTVHVLRLILDFFAVRTMNEVTILKCLHTEEKRPSVHHWLSIPVPSFASTSSKYIADTTFDPSGTRIVTITDQGYWSISEISTRKESEPIASGVIVVPSLPERQVRTGWWKLEWSERETLLVAESKGLHLLNLEVRRWHASS
jgi:hypothetical protein